MDLDGFWFLLNEFEWMLMDVDTPPPPSKKTVLTGSFFCLPPGGFYAIGFGRKLFLYRSNTNLDTSLGENLKGFDHLVMENGHLEVEDRRIFPDVLSESHCNLPRGLAEDWESFSNC